MATRGRGARLFWRLRDHFLACARQYGSQLFRFLIDGNSSDVTICERSRRETTGGLCESLAGPLHIDFPIFRLRPERRALRFDVKNQDRVADPIRYIPQSCALWTIEKRLTSNGHLVCRFTLRIRFLKIGTGAT